MADEFKFFGVDRYEMNARLRPALFAVLPVLILAATWVPKVWTFLGGLSSLAVTCGLTMLMSNIARHQGRKLQEAAGERLGPPSSAAALRFRDGRIDPVTKDRYHQFLGAVGHAIPTPADEAADSITADQRYRGCVSWLLERTRDKKKFPLVAEENIAYGYRRNMCGLKVFAVPIIVMCLFVNTAMTYLAGGASDQTAMFKGIAIGVGYVLVLCSWLFLVNAKFVEDASDSYAVRLLASCDLIGLDHEADKKK